VEVNVTSPTPTSPNAPGLISPSQYFPTQTLQPLPASETSLANPTCSQEQYLTDSLLSIITTNYSSKSSSSYLPSASRAKARLTGTKKGSKGPHGDLADDANAIESPGENSGPGLIAGFGTTFGLGIRGGSLEPGGVNSATFGIGGGQAGGAANILEPILDLKEFVRIVVGDRAWTRDKRLGRNLKKKKEGGSISLTNQEVLKLDVTEVDSGDIKHSPGKTKDNDGGTSALITGSIAGSLRALWTGRVLAVVHLREKIDERRQAAEKRLVSGLEPVPNGGRRGHERPRQRISSVDSTQRSSKEDRKYGLGGLWSDGDATDDQQPFGANTRRTGRKNGNISTEDESDLLSISASLRPGSIGSAGSSGGLWGRSGKVRGKLESWTGFVGFRIKCSI
jgi:hypothetical protein